MSESNETQTNIQKITPHLWFEDNAEEAESAAEVSGRPKGTVMTVTFELEGQQFIALNGGPIFKFSPAISFLVSCETQKEVDVCCADGGMAQI